MPQQVADGDLSFGVLFRKLAVFLDEYFHIGELRNMFRDRPVQIQLALLHQLHSGNAGDRFGHRVNPPNRIPTNRHILSFILLAPLLVVTDFVVFQNHGVTTNDLAGLDTLGHHLIDFAQNRDVETECCRVGQFGLPPSFSRFLNVCLSDDVWGVK